MTTVQDPAAEIETPQVIHRLRQVFIRVQSHLTIMMVALTKLKLMLYLEQELHQPFLQFQIRQFTIS